MADLSRYQVIAGVVTCKDCPPGSLRKIVAAYGPTSSFSVADMNTEIFVHENDHHQAVFEDTASEVGLAAKRVATALKDRAEAVRVELGDSGHDPATAYRNEMIDGMSGPVGEMGALLGLEVALSLSRALSEIAEMDGQYDELIQDHNRKTCDDFTCFVFGHLVDVARAIDRQLQRDAT